MKALLLFMMVILVSACGSGKGGESTSVKPDAVRMELTDEEKVLVKKLIENRSVLQIDLLKQVLKLEALSSETFKRLDLFLTINCSESSGLCEITQKDEV